MEWLTTFPTLGTERLRDLKRAIDLGFREFTRGYGSSIEAAFEPLRVFLIQSEAVLTGTPWPIVIAVLAGLAFLASRRWSVVALTVAVLLLVGLFGLWTDTMKTVSMTFAATILSVAIGIPAGIAMSASRRLERLVTPLLDVMQTMPSFVYLIPVVMLLGIGRVPGLIAVVIYALPPVIRFTCLGIRLVDRTILEAADAFGASPVQRLAKVQFPLALPTIMAGINQTIMMALAMVVVASMIGVQGLGQQVLKAISNQYFTLGLFNGLAIVGIAIAFDRVSQAYGRRLQSHREAGDGR